MQARKHEEASAAAAAHATAAAGAQSVLAGRVTELEEQLQAARTAADVDADAARCPKNFGRCMVRVGAKLSRATYGAVSPALYVVGNISTGWFSLPRQHNFIAF